MQRCFKQSQSLSDRPWSPLHPQRQTSPTSAFSLHISRERSRSSILLPFNPSGRKYHQTVAAAKEAKSVESVVPVTDLAKRALNCAANSTRQIGWFSFWTQLALSIVSAVILLFSVAFTSQNGPGVSLYLTLFGVIASFLSTFWAYGVTRLSIKLKSYAQAGPQANVQRIRKKDVLSNLERGCWINIIGIVATLLGLQATVGLLVAKTLTNATANPFLSGGAGSYNPVLALDVFQVQASTNTLLSHFVSMLSCLWIIRVVGRNSTTPTTGLVSAAA